MTMSAALGHTTAVARQTVLIQWVATAAPARLGSMEMAFCAYLVRASHRYQPSSWPCYGYMQGSVYMDQHMRNTLESTTNNYVSTSPSYTLAVDSLSMLTSIVPSLSTTRNSLIGRVLCSVLGTYCVDLNLCNNSFADYYSGDDDSALLCTSLCTLL